MYKVYSPNDSDSFYEFSLLHQAQKKAKELNSIVMDHNNEEVKIFKVERKQSHYEYFEIEASSEKSAIEKLQNRPYQKAYHNTWGEEYFYEAEEAP